MMPFSGTHGCIELMRFIERKKIGLSHINLWLLLVSGLEFESFSFVWFLVIFVGFGVCLSCVYIFALFKWLSQIIRLGLIISTCNLSSQPLLINKA